MPNTVAVFVGRLFRSRVLGTSLRLSARQASQISRDDLQLVLRIPFYVAVAWLVPQRHWRAVSRYLTSGGSTTVTRAIVSCGIPNAAETAAALEAGRIEHFFQILRAWRPGGWDVDPKIIGECHLTAAIADGKGAILWIDHTVFNGLLPKQALHDAGYPYAHLSRPAHGFSKTPFGIRFLNPIRARLEDRFLKERVLIRRGAEAIAVRRLYSILSEGGTVSVTAGAWEGRQVVETHCLGHRLHLATGAPALAHATGAALLPLTAVREDADGRFRVIIGAPLTCDPGLMRREAVQALADAYGAHVGQVARRWPSQWRSWRYLIDASRRNGAE